MRINYRRLKKLWLLYLFLLFFSFFMFAISINVYLSSISEIDARKRNIESHRKLIERGPKNIVVAHYMGTANLFGNISKEEYDQNNFAPIDSEGKDGKPVVIPARESLIMQRKFQINYFNILASDRIPLNRSIPDIRRKECIRKKYPNDLPKTSVIIVFHNEAWSVLLRTVWSVVNRSPRHLIEEILLVDDASDRKFLKEDLDNYVTNFPVSVRVLRLSERKGLVPARLVGAGEAKGEVLTFLDAHCECSPGWLEPLLARIKQNRQTVVCPVIDIISYDNFSYIKTFETHWGAFNWQLNFRWFVLRANQVLRRTKDLAEPFHTPTMAGGLFSMDRKYFWEIGSYDENMRIWGAENIEMSFRVWQCGGVVEISPCSHVGHIFRKTSPYTFPGGMAEILSENLARVALVWMDEWKDFMFMYNPLKPEYRELNVSSRLQLRERLNCKSFGWYLKNVWPSNFFPEPEKLFGKIVLLNNKTTISKIYEALLLSTPKLKDWSWETIIQFLNKNYAVLLNTLSFENDSCLRLSLNTTTSGESLSPAEVTNNCLPIPTLQDMFVITSDGQFMTNEGLCLDIYGGDDNDSSQSNKFPVARLITCSGAPRQKWTYSINTQQIQHPLTNLCLAADDSLVDKTLKVFGKPCNNTNTQKWAFVPLPWKKIF